MSFDRYGSDVLGGMPAPAHHRARPVSRPQPAERGLVVEEVQTGWVGAVVRVEKSGGMHVVVLEDRARRTRTFPLGPGFWVDGEPVELTAPVTSRAPAAPARSSSTTTCMPPDFSTRTTAPTHPVCTSSTTSPRSAGCGRDTGRARWWAGAGVPPRTSEP